MTASTGNVSTKPPRLVVLGLTGVSGSGKDSVALALAPLGYFRLGLADPIKSSIDDMGGPTRDFYKRIAAAEWSLRKAWAELGTEARIAVGCPDVYVDMLLTKIAFLHLCLPPAQRIHRFVVPDGSYPEEVTKLRSVIEGRLGGVYKVARVANPKPAPLPEHHSIEEHRANLPADFVIENDGDLITLGYRARKAVAENMDRES